MRGEPHLGEATQYRTGSGSDRTQVSTVIPLRNQQPHITEPGAVTALNKQVDSSRELHSTCSRLLLKIIPTLIWIPSVTLFAVECGRYRSRFCNVRLLITATSGVE